MSCGDNFNNQSFNYGVPANCGDSRGVVCVSGQPALATQVSKRAAGENMYKKNQLKLK